MKYTFIKNNGNKQTVDIPDAWLNDQRKNLGISHTEACHLWLFDHDYISNDEVSAMTKKAHENGLNTAGNVKTKHKPPVRKPDETKRELVDLIYTVLCDDDAYNIEDVEVTNIERMIAFRIGDDKYEITLSKKRKPKVTTN